MPWKLFITKQRKRLGGDWAVAHAIFSRTQRDKLRQKLGPELVFIVLNMTKECQKKRLKARHGDAIEGLNEVMNNMFDLYEPARDDEKNTFNVVITEDMTPDDVLNKVFQIISNL